MKRILILAAIVLPVGGCASIMQPFYEAELKKVEAERAAADAKVEAVRAEINDAIEKERDDALTLLLEKAGIERTYEHATVDFRFDLQAIDIKTEFRESAAQANIARYTETLDRLALERTRLEAQWTERLETAQANDDWAQTAVGAGLAAIPGAGAILAAIWQTRRKTKEDVTAEFRDAIAIAREEPEVDRLVTGDSALGRSLRELMRRRPDIARVVKKDDMHRPATPPPGGTSV